MTMSYNGKDTHKQSYAQAMKEKEISMAVSLDKGSIDAGTNRPSWQSIGDRITMDLAKNRQQPSSLLNSLLHHDQPLLAPELTQEQSSAPNTPFSTETVTLSNSSLNSQSEKLPLYDHNSTATNTIKFERLRIFQRMKPEIGSVVQYSKSGVILESSEILRQKNGMDNITANNPQQIGQINSKAVGSNTANNLGFDPKLQSPAISIPRNTPLAKPKATLLDNALPRISEPMKLNTSASGATINSNFPQLNENNSLSGFTHQSIPHQINAKLSGSAHNLASNVYRIDPSVSSSEPTFSKPLYPGISSVTNATPNQLHTNMKKSAIDNSLPKYGQPMNPTIPASGDNLPSNFLHRDSASTAGYDLSKNVNSFNAKTSAPGISMRNTPQSDLHRKNVSPRGNAMPYTTNTTNMNYQPSDRINQGMNPKLNPQNTVRLANAVERAT
jgi:hypothetical protein